MIKNKISIGQLFCLILLMRTFTLMSSPFAFSSNGIAGAAISCVLQFLLIVPAILKWAKGELDIKNEPKLSLKILFGACFLVFTLEAAALIDLFAKVSEVIRFPIGSKIVAVTMLMLTCVYASHLGMRAISRAGSLIFALACAALVMLTFGAATKIELINLTLPTGTTAVLKSAALDLAQSFELIPFFILLMLTENKKKSSKPLYFYLVVKFALIFIISIIGICLLGNLMRVSEYPFFSIGAFSQPFEIQRTDALYITLYTLTCVLSVSVLLFLSSSLLAQIFPKFRYAKFTSLAAIILAFCVIF